MSEAVAEAARNYPKPSGDTHHSEAQAPQKSAAREYGEAFGIALILALIIRTFFIQAYKIPSGSMEPTLLIGDHILVNKLIYGLRMPDSFFGLDLSRRSVGSVPFSSSSRFIAATWWSSSFRPIATKDFIKRVIGVAGDTVAVKNGVVWLNGSQMRRPACAFRSRRAGSIAGLAARQFRTGDCPARQAFMMGDNRDRSYDSRFWGFVDLNDVEGRATIIYLPWNEEKADGASMLSDILLWFDYIRWDRVGMIVH